MRRESFTSSFTSVLISKAEKLELLIILLSLSFSHSHLTQQLMSHPSKRRHSEDKGGQRRTHYNAAQGSTQAPPPKRQLYSTINTSRANQGGAASSSSTGTTHPQPYGTFTIPLLSSRVSSAASDPRSSSRQSMSSLSSGETFVTPTRAISDCAEYSHIALRGTQLQHKKGGAAVPMPNKFGFNVDSTRESVVPTSAPVARWTIANHNGHLQAAFEFRLGVNPVYAETYRENGQVTLYIMLENVNPEQAKREPNGPLLLRTAHQPQGPSLSHAFFRRLPLAIPTDQMTYRHNHHNVLIGTGCCVEEKSTARFWNRAAEIRDKMIQVGADPHLAQAQVVAACPASQEEQWDDIISKFPAEWLEPANETSLQDPMISLFANFTWDVQAQVTIACKVTLINRAHAATEGKVLIEHDAAYLKNRMKRFAHALPTIAQEIQKLKLARSATFKKMKETVRALYDEKQQQDAAARLE